MKLPRLVMSGRDTALVNRAMLKYKVGKWRIYYVVFVKKHATLILDHEIQRQYRNLFRVTDYIFIGTTKREGSMK